MPSAIKATYIWVVRSTNGFDGLSIKVKVVCNDTVDVVQASVYELSKVDEFLRSRDGEVQVVDVRASLANHFQVMLQHGMLILSKCLVEEHLVAIVESIAEVATRDVCLTDPCDAILSGCTIAEAATNQSAVVSGEVLAVCHSTDRS